jgi:hypothetical protein
VLWSEEGNVLLSKAGLLQLLVDLAAVNDAQLVDEDRILTSDICAAEDRALVREAAYAIRALLAEFSYLASPKFERLVAGKSPAVVAMQRKLASDPVRRKHNLELFETAMQQLLVSERAYELAAVSQPPVLDRLKAILAAVQNGEA